MTLTSGPTNRLSGFKSLTKQKNNIIHVLININTNIFPINPHTTPNPPPPPPTQT